MTTNANRAYIIKVDGSVIELGHQPTLSEAQVIVGGYVEQIPRILLTNKELVVFGDEDGKIECKPVNVEASKLMQLHTQSLVGDVLVLKGWKSLRSNKYK